MLLLLSFSWLLSFCRSKKVIVRVEGMAPMLNFTKRITTSATTNNEPEILLITSNLLNIRQNAINGMSFRCSFEEKPPPFSVVPQDPDAKYDFSISSIFLDIHNIFLQEISERNYSVIVSDHIEAKYKIEKSDSPNYSGFDFFNDIHINYLVFSKRNSVFFCEKTSNVSTLPIVFSLLVSFGIYLVLLILINIQYFSIHKHPKGFWFLPPNLEITDLDSYELTPLQKHFVYRLYLQAVSLNSSFSGVTKMKRKMHSAVFERCAAIPIPNGYYFVILFKEKALDDERSSLKIDFESSSPLISLKEPPTLEFVSYRDLWPYKILFNLSHNVKCIIPLPLSLISAFQPYGQFLTQTNQMMFKISETLTKNPFLRSNFGTSVEMFCHQVKANRAFCFDYSGQIIFEYNSDSVKPLGREEVENLYGKIDHKKDHYYDDKLLSDNSYCYVASIQGSSLLVTVVISFSSFPNNEILRNLGSPIMMLCCIYVYQMAYSKEQSICFNHFIDLMASSKDFAFWEYSSDFSVNYIVKTSIPDLNFSSPHDIFKEDMFKNKSDYEKLIKMRDKIIETNGAIKQLVIELNLPNLKWVSISAIADYDSVMNKKIVTVIMEEISKIKLQEKELVETLSDVDFAMKALGFHKFSVEHDFALENNSLLQFLGYSDESLTLRDLVYREDEEKLEMLKGNQKIVFRLNSKEENQLWFSAISNGRNGFIFCVNDLIEVRTKTGNSQHSLSSNLIIWSVDPKNESVHALFGLPTIWDVLSVDKNSEFSRFVNFIHQDQKDSFFATYSRLLKGTQQFWTAEMQLLKIGGEYQWHRLSFARSDANRLYCVSMNINEAKMKTDKLFDSFEQRDIMFNQSGIMLWSFDDSKSPIDEVYDRFEPGVKKELTMNWSFVAKYIPQEERREFTQKMTRALRNDQYFEMTVTLLFNEPAHVVFQGKFVPQVSKAIGFCIEINELWKERHIELDNIKLLGERKVERQKNAQSLSHKYLCLFNDAFGILDVLTMKANSRPQANCTMVINKFTSMLMKMFIQPFHPIPRFKKTSADFQLFDTLEAILMPFYICARKKNVEFKIETVGVDFPLVCHSNQHNLSVVLMGLLSRCMNRGKIDIRIGWHSNYLEFEVSLTEEESDFIQNFVTMMKGFGGTPVNAEFDTIANESPEFLGRRNSQKANVPSINLEPQILNSPSDSAVVESRTSKIIAESTKITDSTSSLAEVKSSGVFEKKAIKQFSPIEDFWFSFGYNDHCYMLSLPMNGVVYGSTFPGHIALLSIQNRSIFRQVRKELQSMEVEIKRLDSESIPENSNFVIIESTHPKIGLIQSEIDHMFIKPVLIVITEPNVANTFQATLTPPLVCGQLRAIFNKYLSSSKAAMLTSFKSTIHADIIKRRVLIVEDNKTNQFVMVKILEALGCTYSIAESGEEALQMLDEAEFDIVLMDYWLPILDGVATTRIIRKSPKHYSSIPIVAVSAVTDCEQECLNAGMNAFFVKPVRIHHIKEALTRFYVT